MFKLSFALLIAVVCGAPALGKHRALLAKKSTKAAPSVHAKAALNAKLALLTEANAPNKRSKKMEKKALLATENQTESPNHKGEASAGRGKLNNAHAAYNELKQKCIACKLAEDAVVSQLELVVSLHDYADERLDEYNSAKAAAETASTKASTLEDTRDLECDDAPTDIIQDAAACQDDRDCPTGYYCVLISPPSNTGCI
jgi:hypothetical protein